jgi:hypothetical protein
MNDANDPLDRLIDEALASYTPQQARPGLEQRVLSSIASAANETSPHPSRLSWNPAWLFAALALLLAVAAIPVWLRSGHPQITAVRRAAAPQAEHSPLVATAAAAAAAPPSSTQRALNPRSRRTDAVARLPLQPQFGRPSPTREELLMALFATQEPEMVAALVKSKPDLDAPITIAPITIAPIPDDPIPDNPIEIKPIPDEPIQISSLN